LIAIQLKIYLNIKLNKKKKYSWLVTGGLIGINFDKSELISNLGRIRELIKYFVMNVIVRVNGK
jgi:hypothetical protein